MARISDLRLAALLLCLPVVAPGTLPAGAAPAAERVTISPQEAWSGLFGGQEVTLNYTISSPEDLRGRLGWSLSVDGRTFARGEVAFAAGANRPGRAAVRFKSPQTKPGVIVDARLAVRVLAPGRNEIPAGHDRVLRIFPDDPFALRSEWLKELKIRLFDPQGDTQKILQRAKIPFEQVHNAAALPQMTDGLLVVGQGISFEEHRSLPESLVRMAAGGVPVLCLAPSAGSLPMPGANPPQPELPTPKRVVLRREDAITALDKRLDAAAWPPDGQLVASTVSITADRSRVMGQVGKKRTGWPWIEVRFPGKRATLLICGFGIVDRWDAGPTPRYLFAQILEFIAPPPNATEQ